MIVLSRKKFFLQYRKVEKLYCNSLYIRRLWIEIFRPENLFLSVVGKNFPGPEENNRPAMSKPI